ncbi:MAG: hypothetical protein H8E37_04430 [Planctomycetes bacterium]|nr:hypothetical protein [Planctomycetota bacterium]
MRLHTVNPAHLDPYDQIPNLPNERRLKIFLRREASGGTTAIFLTEIFMVEDYLGTGEHARNVLTRNLDELRSHPRVAPVIDEVYVEVRPEPGVSWGEILKTLHIAQGVPGSDGQPNSRFQLIGLEGIHYEEAP